MLFSLGHGRRVFAEADPGPVPEGVRAPCVVQGDGPPGSGRFGYYFPDATDVGATGITVQSLDALAAAMVEEDGDPAAQNSSIPPIFTYLGQFIDHDVSAGTDREIGLSTIAAPFFYPQPRAKVSTSLVNLRLGTLGLDSLYGDTPGQGAFADRLRELLRFPRDRRKMWIAFPEDVPPRRLPKPADGAADVLRLGRLVQGAIPPLPLAEIEAQSPDIRDTFLEEDGTPKVQRAILGDARNDENLIVAQLHLAFLRLHNVLVDHCDDAAVREEGGEAVFEWAQRRVRWTYQWIVINEFLPTVCDPHIVGQVLADEAPLYRAFLTHCAPPAGSLPVPLEFSVAAYRFGHSMVRGDYDFNPFFGRTTPGFPPLLPRAPFDLLFQFTGNGMPPMPTPQAGSFDKLPSNWVIDWARFVHRPPLAMPDRSARKIDTRLAPALDRMRNETDLPAEVFQKLATRNLRRGFRLNLPSAQDCIRHLDEEHGIAVRPLSLAELTGGRTGPALCDGLIEHTPLWFYVLKEAEVQANGEYLGGLGSHLVAQTLVGLIVQDPTSYWNAKGADGQRWSPPATAAMPDGDPIDSIADVLKAALVL
ncbi:MAG: heme peroxidase family protein [Pseudomonadota bacterium]